MAKVDKGLYKAGTADRRNGLQKGEPDGAMAGELARDDRNHSKANYRQAGKGFGAGNSAAATLQLPGPAAAEYPAAGVAPTLAVHLPAGAMAKASTSVPNTRALAEGRVRASTNGPKVAMLDVATPRERGAAAGTPAAAAPVQGLDAAKTLAMHAPPANQLALQEDMMMPGAGVKRKQAEQLRSQAVARGETRAGGEAMLVECNVRSEAARGKAFEDLLARNGLKFHKAVPPEKAEGASGGSAVVYEVEATSEKQIGGVLFQLAQNTQSYGSYTVSNSTAERAEKKSSRDGKPDLTLGGQGKGGVDGDAAVKGREGEAQAVLEKAPAQQTEDAVAMRQMKVPAAPGSRLVAKKDASGAPPDQAPGMPELSARSRKR